MRSSTLRTWAGNYTYSTDRVHRPRLVEEVREVVARERKIRVLGTRHSFNPIADSTEALLSTERLNRVVGLDRAARTVTVEAGITYGALGAFLHGAGFGLHNLASLPHISVAGACATGTHGSGDGHGNLATAVAGMELVKADGEVVTLSHAEDGGGFDGMVVALGGLGVVTKVTLGIAPTFAVRQQVYEGLPLRKFEENFEAIAGSAYSVSFFTDWRNDHANQVWLKRRGGNGAASESAAAFFGATLAPAHRHPIVALSAENCTPQMGIAGPWHERLPHFRMEFTPSSGQELQTEYLVPRAHAAAALGSVARLSGQITPLLLISEVRTIAADNLWMSPCYGHACMAIHFTWKPNWPAVREVLLLIEQELETFHARPHWGKHFAMPPARLQSLYKRLPDFRSLLTSYDPDGKFRNAFMDAYIFGTNADRPLM